MHGHWDWTLWFEIGTAILAAKVVVAAVAKGLS